MNKMDLFGQSKESTGGTEIPGTISIYMVQLSSGGYYVAEEGGNFLPETTEDWSKAKFMFGFNGMLEAKEIANRFRGQVYIVNCTSPAPYIG